MLSARWLRENIDVMKESLAKRKVEVDLDTFLKLDEERRKLAKQVDELKAIQNKNSQKIAQLKSEGEDVSSLISEMQKLATRVKKLEKKRKIYEEKVREFLLNLPNRLHPDVPRDANEEVRRWGQSPHFDFQVKDHQKIGEELDILDFKAAAKITGSGFVV